MIEKEKIPEEERAIMSEISDIEKSIIANREKELAVKKKEDKINE